MTDFLVDLTEISEQTHRNGGVQVARDRAPP
jgi:hypothetical protein